MFEDLVGCTISVIEGAKEGSDRIVFKTDQGEFCMYHESDCCEHVSVNEIVGDVDDLIGTPVLQANAISSTGDKPLFAVRSVDEKLEYLEHTLRDDPTEHYSGDSHTWTFYRIVTIKGTVVLRWLGTSNGYYSESVSFYKA